MPSDVSVSIRFEIRDELGRFGDDSLTSLFFFCINICMCYASFLNSLRLCTVYGRIALYLCFHQNFLFIVLVSIPLPIHDLANFNG